MQLTIRAIFSIQLYNDFVLSTLLLPHELSCDFLREKEYISENVKKTTFLKIWTTFNSSLFNSKNMNNSKNYYETVQIHLQQEGNRWLETTGVPRTPATSKMGVSLTIVNSGTLLDYCHKEIHVRHCRSASTSRT